MKDLGPFPKATDMSRGVPGTAWERVTYMRVGEWGGKVKTCALVLGIKVEILGGRNLKLHGRRTERTR